MFFRFTLFNDLTLVLMALTIWVGVARFAARLESNWFLIYYALLVAYWKVFEGSLNTYWVLAGVACGLLLRFEFLGGPVLKAVRAVELVVFGVHFVALRGTPAPVVKRGDGTLRGAAAPASHSTRRMRAPTRASFSSILS